MILKQTIRSSINNHLIKIKIMIRLQNIEKVYQTDTIETLALNRINLNIDKGEFISIMGPSGCGKSTLLNIIGLLDAPTKGNVQIDAQTTDDLSNNQLAHFRNRKLGFIFQSYHLINDLRVLDNVELPLLYRKCTAKERKELATARLKKWAQQPGKTFSYTIIGRPKTAGSHCQSNSGQPEIILADEPQETSTAQWAMRSWRYFFI